DGAPWGRAFIPWQKRHFRPRDPFGREWKPLPGAEDRIAADFGTIAMMVSDADMPDLPPLNVVVMPVTLPDAVMAAYATMQRELLRLGMPGRCRCSPCIRHRPGTDSICSTAGRAWRGYRRAGRPNSPSRRSRGSTGRDRRGT